MILYRFFVCIVTTISFVSIMGKTNANNLTIPNEVTIQADSCDQWNKRGSWINTVDPNIIAHFESDCRSALPSDIFIKNASGYIFGHIDIIPQSTSSAMGVNGKISFMTTKFHLQDENNNVLMSIKEIITSSATYGTKMYYDISYGYVDMYIKFYKNTETGLYDTFAVKNIGLHDTIGTGKIIYNNNPAINYFCNNGTWKIVFQSSMNHLQRLCTLVSVTFKSIRDMDRDSKGNVNQINCNSIHWFLIFSMSIFGIYFIVITYIVFIRIKKINK